MSDSKSKAREGARFRSPGDVWIDHATVVPDDEEWLRPVEKLTLWNVKLPRGFLARLPSLRCLDLRGGAGAVFDHADGCCNLELLVINQVRGLTDVRAIADLTRLRFLSLYGMPKVVSVPSLGSLKSLRRLELGSMKGVRSIAPLLDAPFLHELLILRSMAPGSVDVAAIKAHPTLELFGWFAEDVPVATWRPVVDAVGLPKPRLLAPEAWLAAQSHLPNVP